MTAISSSISVAFCLIALGPSADAAELLHPIFTDHAVLQRDRPIEVWGTANPGERIAVTLDRGRVETTTKASGAWIATLPALSAGGPHTLAVSSTSATQTLRDVLIGDVWLCSGQSNMVLPVNRALDARSEIANAQNDSIRLLTIPQASSAVPQTTLSERVEWRLASASSVPEFSAACWYFARELQKSVDVPMGLIASAWGGSRIETWMSAKALRAHGGYDDPLDILQASVTNPFDAHSRWGAHWESWWRKQTASEPWSMQSSGEWRKAPLERGPWEEWGDPRLANYNGMLWYRTTISLTIAQASQSATLSLGQVDEVDQTWVNGRPIGARTSARLSREERVAPVIGPGPNRVYRLPRGALLAGENVIVVNVLDTYATGGLRGPASSRSLQLADGTKIALNREWFYQLPPRHIGSPPRAPWENVAGLGVIYNGMIAPLKQFGIRGVAWYQGESNTETAGSYGTLLKHLMADWRDNFGPDLPFLIVQLANYGQPPTQPTASGWAVLREQQRIAVEQDKNAALVVAIDLGDRYDIHPANKQQIGQRLARAARQIAFGESIAPSGPRIVDAQRDGDRVVVSFTDVSGKLIAYSANGPIGFELCDSEQDSCRFVAASIDGNRVVLDAAALGSPTRVRYCWADSPVCTLYDEAHLPAGPFQIEVQR